MEIHNLVWIHELHAIKREIDRLDVASILLDSRESHMPGQLMQMVTRLRVDLEINLKLRWYVLARKNG
jgi:hypothetical protein